MFHVKRCTAHAAIRSQQRYTETANAHARRAVGSPFYHARGKLQPFSLKERVHQSATET